MTQGFEVLSSIVTTLLLQAAQTGTDYTPPDVPPAPDMGPVLWRLAGMMGFIFLILAGLTFWIWFVRRPVRMTQDERQLRLIHQTWLGRRCCLNLIEARSCRLVVAVDPQGIKFCQPVSGDFASLLPGYDPRDQSGPSVEEIMALLAAARTAA
jgi:hypothetical protein